MSRERLPYRGRSRPSARMMVERLAVIASERIVAAAGDGNTGDFPF
jgi:hypothetical protein